MSAAKENPCRKFQANIFNKSKCQNCFKPRESHLLNDEDLTQVSRWGSRSRRGRQPRVLLRLQAPGRTDARCCNEPVGLAKVPRGGAPGSSLSYNARETTVC